MANPGPAEANARLVDTALTAKRATRAIAFKREFFAVTPGAWCELLKDVVAMANSGGGVIVLGLASDGTPSGWDPTQFLTMDGTDFVSAWSEYLGERLPDFEVREVKKGEQRLAAIVIEPRTGSPLVFEKPCTYRDGDAQRTAFTKGTVYFRHGARSDPGSARDLARFVEREVRKQRREWLGNVRKAAAAPKDAQILVVTPTAIPGESTTDVRVVDDPAAPAAVRTDFDRTHPYRQTEVIARVNAALGPKTINSYGVLCVRRVHDVDRRDEFFHRPKFGSPQYSQAFVDWLIREYRHDKTFFDRAKHEAKARSRQQ
jgi:hypothetical protein